MHTGPGVGLLLILSQALAMAAEPAAWRLDMGCASGGAVAPGFVHVGPTDRFDAERGWGWAQPNLADRAFDRHTPDVPVYHRRDHPLYDVLRDGVTAVGPNSFRIAVPAGSYRVTLQVGDLSPTEARPRLFARVNGVVFLDGVDLPGGQVRAYVGHVTAAAAGVNIEVEGRGPQRYFPLAAVVVEAEPAGSDAPVSFTIYPEVTATPVDYQENWRQFTAEFLADWSQAKSELQAAGLWSDAWQQQAAALRSVPGYRPLFASSTLRADRVEERAQVELDTAPLLQALREAGLDGLISADRATIRGLRRAGLQFGLMASGLEHLPESESANVTPIRIRKADGTFSEIAGTYSVFDARAVDMLRRHYLRFADIDGALFLTLDEPRGAWFAGGTGDYSEPAQAAFRKWAAEQGCADAARSGCPAPARTWDFYRFYRFRVGATARFIRQVTEALPELRVPIVPGNGDLGPGTLNHCTLHPPEAARLGLGSASWLYGGPKAGAEFLRATEEECGARTQAWTCFHFKSPMQEVTDSGVVLAAMSEVACIWHQGTFLTGRDRVEWLKALYLVARLTHATSGLTRATGVYLYAPDSLVYNDLVGDRDGSEAAHWRELTDSMVGANVDFRVTFLHRSPEHSLVVYAPLRAVLTESEAADVGRYLDAGGTFVYACPTPPELPDGSELGPLARRLETAAVSGHPRLRWWRQGVTPDAVRGLAEELAVETNPVANGLLTFAYKRGDGTRFWLAVNRSPTTAGDLTLAAATRDLFSGEACPAGAPVRALPSSYRFLSAAP